jgi:hypothetical protein
MGKAERTVAELVGMIKRGELRLPEMQRGYVWRGPRVRDLLDSLYRGYPSGAILTWETDEDVPIRKAAIKQEESSIRGMLLLDGQQRLTSLAAVLGGEPVTVRGGKKIELLFNLEHPEVLPFVTEVDEDGEDEGDDEGDEDSEVVDADEDELSRRFRKMTFIVSTQKLAALPTWVKVTDVFKAKDNAAFIKRAGVKDFEDERFTRYNERLNKLKGIKGYTYRLDILESTLSYNEVTEIFVRVNSLGAKLRSSDLAMAQITAKWPHSLSEFEAFQTKRAADGFGVDLGIHVKNLVVVATGQSRFETVRQLSRKKLETAWEECMESFTYAVDFARSNAHIESPALLSSPFLMIALGYAGHSCKYKMSKKDAALLKYWALVANAKGRWSRGSSETILDQDLTRIRQGGGSGALIELLKTQFGRLDIQEGDLVGRNARSSYFKTMFMAFKDAGAVDWESKLITSMLHIGKSHQLQFHHIFPKALLRGKHPGHVINDIANLAFLGGKTNREISSKPPQEYLAIIVDGTKKREAQGEEVLEAQCIPTDRDLWRIDRYEAFLAARRRLIAERLNEFLESSLPGGRL